MSISELNHFMTYVLEAWMLFSAGFVSIGFVSFASRRIQEDIEADALALTQAMEEAVAEAEKVSDAEAVMVEEAEVVDEEALEAARIEEVAAVSQ
ncbi:MAG: hypothetical protein AAFY72_14730, partial [Cyanobacteria bacterium J06649_4]